MMGSADDHLVTMSPFVVPTTRNTRPLERVSVKGKAKGSIVYELLARHDEAHNAVQRLAALTAEGLDLYHAREFSQALRAYEEAARIDPDDRCAALMIEGCSAYIATPPSDDWSGIRRMDAK